MRLVHRPFSIKSSLGGSKERDTDPWEHPAFTRRSHAHMINLRHVRVGCSRISPPYFTSLFLVQRFSLLILQIHVAASEICEPMVCIASIIYSPSVCLHPVLQAQNTFDTIKIEDLLRRVGNENRTLHSATLSRMTIPENLIAPYPHPDLIDSEYMEGFMRPEKFHEPNGPLPRPPSKLPPPAHATLSFKLGRRMASGMTGVVYEAIDVRIAPSPDHGTKPTGYLPPLVVKIGRSNRCMSMGREAWFYNEMESLQGIAIARCYGCFELELQRGMLAEPWQDRLNRTDYDNEYDELPDFIEYPEEALEEKEVDPHPLLKKLIKARNRLCITVLERLGPALEPGVVHPLESRHVLFSFALTSSPYIVVHHSFLREEIKSMYTNTAALGVHLSDTIVRQNILHAPKSPPGIPSQVSPFTGRTHAWRAVGFGGAIKILYKRWLTDGEQDEWVDVMWASIAYLGSIPSDDSVWPPGLTA